MRHNINKILNLSFAISVLCSILMLSACKKDEKDLSTVKLSVFGPSPALRGGELRFIGTNMDKVTAIVLPPNFEITEFVSKSATECVIAIPQDAKPGKVTVKTPQGDITTLTPLTFSEPISIETVAPLAVKAGDTFTVNGDYLNLIAEIIFSDGVVVDSSKFLSQSRKKIEVQVPLEAQTGKISISNGAEIPILVYSESEVQIALPTLTAVSPNPVKPGTTLKISGKNFQLVKSIIFPETTEVKTFTVNNEKTEISVTVPANAKEGELILVTHSDVRVTTTIPLSLVAPAVSSVLPKPVKNGETLTINGSNLDLVSTVSFSPEEAGEIVSQTSSKLEIKVPLKTTDGKITLTAKSGKKIETESITLIKPTINAIAPLTLMAGNQITITGTNLDLVLKVSFVGNLSVDVTPASANSITVTVPPACVGVGKVIVTTTNGTQVSSDQQLTVEAANKPVITSIPTSVKPNTMMTIKGTKLHLVESIYFQNNVKATSYGNRSETSIEVYVPESAKKGAVTLRLVAYNGDEVISPEFIISGTDPVIDVSYVFFNFNGKNSWWGDKGAIENNPTYSLDGSSYFRINDDMKPWWTGFFWRNGKNDLKTDGVTTDGWAVKLDVNALDEVKGEMKLRLKGSDGDFWAVIPGLKNKGGWYTVTIPLTSFDDNGKKIPNMNNIDGDFGMAYTGAGEHVNLCIDNIRFEKNTGAAGVRSKIRYSR